MERRDVYSQQIWTMAVIGSVSIAISRTGTGAASTRDPGIGFAGRRLRRGLAGGYYVGRPAARQRYNS